MGSLARVPVPVTDRRGERLMPEIEFGAVVDLCITWSQVLSAAAAFAVVLAALCMGALVAMIASKEGA